jgi:hypothetical protein
MAGGDLIMIQDADYEYDPADVPSLVQPFIEDEADVVFGSRFKKNAPQVHRTWHYFVNRLLTILSNMCSGIYLTDMETCYKIFRADFVQGNESKGGTVWHRGRAHLLHSQDVGAYLRAADTLLSAHYAAGQEDQLEGRHCRLYHLVRFIC